MGRCLPMGASSEFCLSLPEALGRTGLRFEPVVASWGRPIMLSCGPAGSKFNAASTRCKRASVDEDTDARQMSCSSASAVQRVYCWHKV